MGRFGFVVIAAALLAPLAAPAHAADMPRLPLPGPLPDVVPPSIVEWSSGWYIRGDVSYRFDRSLESAVNEIVATSPTTNNLGDNYALGLGAGYKNKWFRADITGEYSSRLDYNGSNGAFSQSMRIDGYTVLGNVYLDLGTWWGITPYVGAGAGMSRLTSQNYTSTPPSGLSPVVQSEWSFSWAYMGGVSFQLLPNVLIDVGYRHLNLGDAIGGPEANSLRLNKIEVDEVRVGLRYTLD